MERLTKRELYDRKVCFTKCAKTNCHHKCAYCDIPEEANARLEEYEDLEEQGKLLKLPCAVEDEVWHIDTYEGIHSAEIVRGTVEGFLWFRTCGFALNVVWDKPIMGYFSYKRKEMPFSQIKKTVFLLREEAEEALKRMEGKR